MATHRQRAVSPQAPRVYLNPPRTTTGTLLTNSYDTRYDARPRASFSTVGSARESLAGRNSVYEAQPVSKKTYVDPSNGGATISRTQYTVRPRRDSDVADQRRPLSVVTQNVSPTRDRGDVVDSPQPMVVYKTPREESSASRYLQPTPPAVRGSAHHQRHSSASRVEVGQFPRAQPNSRPDKEYHRRGPYVEKVADSRPPPVRYSDEDGFSYTGPREQFARDFPDRPARRESLSRRERPTSAMDTKFDPHIPIRRDTAPPPSVSRQLDRIDRDEGRSGFESDPDRSRPERKPRSAMKGPIVHQRDEGYSSAQDYDPRRASRARPQEDDVTTVGKSRYREPPRDPPREFERERDRPRREYDRDDDRQLDREREKGTKRHEKPRDREYERERRRPREYDAIEEEEPPRRSRRQDSSPDRSKIGTLAAAAVGGLATAGIVSHKSGKNDEASDSDSKRERKHRRRRTKDSRDDERRDVEDPEGQPRRRERRSHRDGSSGSDTSEAKPRNRPESRTRNRRDTMDGYGSDRERPQLALPAPEPDRRASRSETALDAPAIRPQQDSPTNDEGRTLSPGEGEDSRPRRVSIVEPTKKEEFKPRGILKPPRAVPFPEDPNPTREGVAPLKQAGKDGIPSGARWTKVSRILVNPEALEKAHERFEERDDYVIVLRVLSREEIEKLAEKTKEIREQREGEWQKQVEERRRRRVERGDRDSEHEDDYDDAPRGPLAIEAPPSSQPADLRQLAAQQHPSQSSQHQQQQQQAYPPMANVAPGQPVPQQQQGYPPRFPWNSGGGQAPRSSGEAIANTPAGQPVPQPQQHHQQQHQQQEFDTSAYSQNV